MTLRRTGFVATLAAGTLMIASALHGMVSVDTSLRLAAVTEQQKAAPTSTWHERHRCGDVPDVPYDDDGGSPRV